MTNLRALLAILIVLLGSLAAAPASAEGTSASCEASGPAPSCVFACPDGAHLRVYTESPGFADYVSAEAECGGATASCSEWGACDTLSPDSTAAATGLCAAGDGASFVYCEALSPPAEGPSCGADGPDYWVCGFTCTAGHRLHVSATTNGPNPSSEWPRLHAACGGVDIYCQSNGGCQASSATVLYNDTGVCRAETVYVDGVCSSGAAPPPPPPPRRKVGAATPPLGVGSFGPYNVSTPRVGPYCAPAGLVCVGPVERREVASVPATPPVRVPSGRAEVDYTDTQVPGVATTRVGPFEAPGGVPLVVCAFGCDVPTGTTGKLVVSAVVRVTFGEHVVERDVQASPP